MANSLEGVLKTLRSIEGYEMQFQKIYNGVTVAAIGDSVAAFVRVIVSGPTPFDYRRACEPFEREEPATLKKEAPELFDRYVQLKKAKDDHPMSAQALRGMELFFDMDKAWCIGCHASPAMTENMFHNIGIGMHDDSPDLGRFLVTGKNKDRGAFKTPSLRNIKLTAPYMHDGRFDTLEQVLEFYSTSEFENPHLDSRFDRIRLTDREQKDLIEFLKSLTGKLPKVNRGRLPKD